MKKVLFSILMVALTTAAFAQQPEATTAAPQQAEKRQPKGERGGAEQGERLKTALGLSDDQAAKVKQIMQDSRTAQKALRDDTTLKGKEKKAKKDALVADRDTKIKAVLTPDQFAKFTEMEAKMKERMKERGGKHGEGRGGKPEGVEQEPSGDN